MAIVLSLLHEHAATALIILLGAAAAFASGRAIAQTWRPYWQLPLYILLLAAVTRFCHFALFEATLLDAQGYVIDLAVLMLAGAAGFRQVRREQMITQYAWIYGPAGPLGWRRIGSAAPGVGKA